jgi:hypothetical protein
MHQMREQREDMSSKDVYPSEQLLESIEEIATIKQALSIRDRSLTSANGLYVRSSNVFGGATQYMAGGKFIAKLVFVTKADGSRDIKKHQVGDWENKVDETLSLCRELKQVYEAQESWDSEKRRAYQVSVTANLHLYEKFCNRYQQYCDEPIKRLESKGGEYLRELYRMFIDELKKEWPREHLELRMINFPQENKLNELEEFLVKNVTVAYVSGDMYDAGLISQEELVNATLGMGDALEGVIRRNLKGAKSKGLAFANSLMRISTTGIIDARKEQGGNTNLPSSEDRAKPSVSSAEVLEEMCRLEDMFGISIHGVGKGLTYAEANIIGRKVNPLFRGSRSFPVSEDASEEEINRWLNHPLINVPLSDTFVMSMATQTPIPASTMERILRTLLQEDYDMYWKMAEERIRSKKLD